MLYLSERTATCAGVPVTAPIYAEVNAVFDRALIHMHKMPLVWRAYLEFLLPQCAITSTRRTFDRALRALPITQHLKWIWPTYLRFADTCGVPETSLRVWRRYVLIAPAEREAFVDALLAAGQVDAAAEQLAALVNDDSFVSQRGRTRHELWGDLLKLLVSHSTVITSIDPEAVIRSGIRRYPHEVARLWNALADLFTRQGLFERARSTYAEALEAVMTVRDFSLVFDAFTRHEEALIESKMAELEAIQAATEAAEKGTTTTITAAAAASAAAAAHGPEPAPASGTAARVTAPTASSSSSSNSSSPLAPPSALQARLSSLSPRQLAAAAQATESDIDMRMLRLERLVDSRPWLVNTVLLRQNPNNVTEWLNRVKLCGSDVGKAVQTFTEAAATIDPYQAEGQAQHLWARFAALYQRAKQWADARAVYERATAADLPSPDALAFLWLRWAEMELLSGSPRRALAVLRKATTPPRDYKAQLLSAGSGGTSALPAAVTVFKSPRLWAMLADVQESVGPLDAVRAVYDRMIQLKVLSPATLLNYASLLEEKGFYEEAFRAYERGVALFPYPAVAPVWVAYLRRFTDRYGGTKLERARDLFEQALSAAPTDFKRPIFLLYAQYEERVGSPRGLMRVLAAACAAVPPAERLELVLLYLVKASECFGAVRTREIFDEALRTLPDADIPLIAARYAALERRLGEVDRARGVYAYAAQFANPGTDAKFWEGWHKFEMMHGNEDTYKDMLRARRAAKAHFEQSALVTAALAKAAKAKDEAVRAEAAEAAAVLAGASAGALGHDGDDGTAAAAAAADGDGEGAGAGAVDTANPDEIDLGFGDDDDEEAGGSGAGVGAKKEEEEGGDVVQMPLPAGLFGGLVKQDNA